MFDVEVLTAKILVVDDDAVIRTVLKSAVVNSGSDAYEAGGGDQALEMLQGNEFDVVLTDISMPGTNGIDVLRAVKSKYPNCPVVLVTSEPSIDNVGKMIALGATDYVVKPFTIDGIKLILAKALAVRKLSVSRNTSEKDTPPSDGLSGGLVIDKETGVLARSAFEQLLKLEVARSRYHNNEFTAMNMGIRRFFSKVSRPGRSFVQLGGIIADNVRPGDVVGRTDSTGFAIILPQTDLKRAQLVFERIQQRAGVWELSCGMASFPTDALDHDDFLKVATERRDIGSPPP